MLHARLTGAKDIDARFMRAKVLGEDWLRSPKKNGADEFKRANVSHIITECSYACNECLQGGVYGGSTFSADAFSFEKNKSLPCHLPNKVYKKEKEGKRKKIFALIMVRLWGRDLIKSTDKISYCM